MTRLTIAFLIASAAAAQTVTVRFDPEPRRWKAITIYDIRACSDSPTTVTFQADRTLMEPKAPSIVSPGRVAEVLGKTWQGKASTAVEQGATLAGLLMAAKVISAPSPILVGVLSAAPVVRQVGTFLKGETAPPAGVYFAGEVALPARGCRSFVAVGRGRLKGYRLISVPDAATTFQ